MAKWWFSKHDYDHRVSPYDVGAGARSWMSQFFDFEPMSKAKSDDRQYQKLLNQLQTSANIIGDSIRLEVRWAGEDSKNGTRSTVLHLSPDGLVKDGKPDDRQIDALTGRVYLATQLHKNVPEGVSKQYEYMMQNRTHQNLITSKIWTAMETAIARTDVMRDWAGFSPYVAAEAAEASESKEAVQEYVDKSVDKPTAEAAATGIAWNLLNPADPVRVPEVYDPILDYAGSLLQDEIPAEKRLEVAKQLASKICEMYGRANSDVPPPSLVESSILGGDLKVEDTSKAQMRSSSGSEASSAGEGLMVDAPELGGSGRLYRITKMNARDGDKDLYRSTLQDLSQAIQSVKNLLQFQNTDLRSEVYGHKSGDVDEGSLYKLFLDDDRVMARREVRDRKKIGITLLVDESGSMSRDHRADRARKVVVTLLEAFGAMPGIDVAVYGHSSYYDDSSGDEQVQLYEYVTKDSREYTSVMNTRARHENLDSWAMMHVGNIMRRDFSDYAKRLMFVISDGRPSGSNYGGESACAHMRDVVSAFSKCGVQMYGVGIANAYSSSEAREMYGEGRAVVVSDVESSAGIIAKFVAQIAKKL